MSITLSERVRNLKPSPTLEITSKAAALQRQGETIISLSAGEPDFDTPEPIKKAALKALSAGHTKYTAVEGILPLREAIVRKTVADTGLPIDPDQVVVGCGAKQVIFNAFLATVNPGDEVLIPAPYWVSYPDMVELAGGSSRVVPCPQDLGFKLTPDILDAAITSATRWVVLNAPSNPTGALYTEVELQALASVMRRYPTVMLLCDDIYEALVYDGLSATSLLKVAPDLAPRTLLVNGVSKSHAMTGWRIGWGCGPKVLMAAMKNIQSQSTSNPCSIAQYAALAGLTDPVAFRRDYLEPWLEAYDERRRYIVAALNDCKGLSCDLPSGAFYVYVKCDGMIGKATPSGKILTTDTDISAYLLDAAKVAVVPGAAFGLSPYFRVSYATSMEQLVKACYAIRIACEALAHTSYQAPK